MKRVLAICFVFIHSASFACSSFLLSKGGRHLFGKNYDWVTGNGALMVNARGLVKEVPARDSRKALNWISTFGSVTFNQFGKEFPNGGMNEKGLVIELMWLDGSSYPPEDARPALGVLQWIQYQLDCSATVADVLDSDAAVRVSGHEGVPLHYLIADITGAAATIEFLNGKRVVRTGSALPFPVLTNSPYQHSIDHLKGGRSGDNSLSRFSTACALLQKASPTEGQVSVPYAFGVLDKVAQGDFTKWRIVYDITRRKIHFSTLDHPEVREVDLARLAFSCSASLLAFPLSSPLATPAFLPFSHLENERLIHESVQASAGRLRVTETSIVEAATFATSPHCK